MKNFIFCLSAMFVSQASIAESQEKPQVNKMIVDLLQKDSVFHQQMQKGYRFKRFVMERVPGFESETIECQGINWYNGLLVRAELYRSIGKMTMIFGRSTNDGPIVQCTEAPAPHGPGNQRATGTIISSLLFDAELVEAGQRNLADFDRLEINRLHAGELIDCAKDGWGGLALRATYQKNWRNRHIVDFEFGTPFEGRWSTCIE